MSHQIGTGLNKGTMNQNSTGMQFYNPAKNQNNPSLLFQHSQSTNTLNTGTSSGNFKSTKQFNFKSNAGNQIKTGTSSTTFIKNSTEHNTGGSNKYIPNSLNSVSSSTIMNKTLTSGITTNSSNIFSSPNHNKSLNSQMIKSSIHDGNNNRQHKNDDFLNTNKETKFKTFQTPIRRAPRMSQPMNGNSDLIKQQPYTSNNISHQIQSPPTFLKEKQKQKEANFHKFKPYQSPLGQKFDKQLHYGSHNRNIANNSSGLSPFRGVQHKNTLGHQQNSTFAHKSYGKKNQTNDNKLSLKNFQKIKELGAGKYGKVFLAKQKQTGFVCAVKMIQKQLLKQEEIVQQFIRQLKIQIFLNHPHIIKMYGYFDDQVNIYIILQVGTGGQLYHQLKRGEPMPQQKVAMYMRQICQAVNQIHSLRIIHRDIKPQNIVLHQNIVKLCDFGWSVHQDNKMRTTFCGTPLYVCPQILRGKQYDQKIDIWSLGIMMYQMLVGQNPFKITKQQQLIKIVKDKIQIPSYVFVSGQARDFLDKCLQKNPVERVNIRELLSHDFFKKYPDKSQKKVGF